MRLKNQMTAPQPTIFTSHLYNQDFYLWIETTAKQLKEGRFSEVDLENLIEEIASMRRSEKNFTNPAMLLLLQVSANLFVVKIHLRELFLIYSVGADSAIYAENLTLLVKEVLVLFQFLVAVVLLLS
jgi:hypothetical protein